MSLVRLTQASFAYAGSADVFTDLNLSFDRGFTALVGENGGGKTTLLRVILGELRLSSGELAVNANLSARILCEQRVEQASRELIDFASCYERKALRWQSRLAVSDLPIEGFASLSPGERKRWQIAWALAQSPQILLLDEPTNHLDANARTTLLDALRSFSGVAIVVSHDREFLEALCPHTVRLEAGGAKKLSLPYAQAKAQWSKDRQRQEEVHRQKRSVLKKTEKRLAKIRDARFQAERSIPASRRIKGPKDSDARSINAKARVAAGEAKLSRQLTTTNTVHQKQLSELSLHALTKVKGGEVMFQGQRMGRRRLASYEGPLLQGSRVLAREIKVEILRGSRILLSGDNGSGKTTLIRTLVRNTQLAPEEYLYLPQDLGASHEAALRSQLAQMSPEECGKTMTIAAALGLRPERALGSNALSPGQLRKLLMARSLCREATFLVLDEPTNHLDLPSVERLEAALLGFPGALLVVSHDFHFARGLGLEMHWRLADARLRCEEMRSEEPLSARKPK